MQKRRQLASALLLAGIACAPPASGPAGPGPGSLVPIATPPGLPFVADPAPSMPLTAAGGSFVSADGALHIDVPPGAVTASADLTITPIANMARGAVGPAFRLGPEGTTFAQPVTLTFKAPDSYPVGASIDGVGVEYQDANGFWHPVEPVVRDAVAKTVTVTTTHFSDWAVTWQGDTASAEGPITLVQTVGVPFTASGRATLFFLGDDAYDTSYKLTGTLTVPDTIAVGALQCTPDQTTKTLPLSVAEVHKGVPPIFRWGIGATWTLSCDDGSTVLMPARFDTMYINLTRCPGDYAAGQIVQADRVAGTYTSDCGADGSVSASWDLQACVAGQECAVPGDCRLGLTVCTAGVQSCVDSGPAPDGTVCGAGGTCAGGVCVPP